MRNAVVIPSEVEGSRMVALKVLPRDSSALLGMTIYSPALLCKLARPYSRFSFAMKLALISAGQTASHS